MTDVGPLIARLSTDRRAARELSDAFDGWWAQRHANARAVLDALAIDAAVRSDSLELLLALIDRHGIARPALRRFLVSADDIADAEQATLAAVALSVGQFKNTAQFTTWLHRVASNEAKMLVRSRARHPPVESELSPVAPFVARLSSLIANQDVIDRALDELPAKFGRPLRLREIDGLEYEEIAETLELPIGTVRSRLSRARAMLVDSLRDHSTME